MKRDQRLRSSADFARTRDRSPRAWPHPLLVLYVAPNELGHTRVGITVSSRVGNAVARNRVRRRLKEALRARFDRLAPGIDLLVIARAPSARATWSDLSAGLDTLLVRARATEATPSIVQAAVNSA